eukprot:3826522-Rhodomonas_salina.1
MHSAAISVRFVPGLGLRAFDFAARAMSGTHVRYPAGRSGVWCNFGEDGDYADEQVPVAS